MCADADKRAPDVRGRAARASGLPPIARRGGGARARFLNRRARSQTTATVRELASSQPESRGEFRHSLRAPGVAVLACCRVLAHACAQRTPSLSRLVVRWRCGRIPAGRVGRRIGRRGRRCGRFVRLGRRRALRRRCRALRSGGSRALVWLVARGTRGGGRAPRRARAGAGGGGDGRPSRLAGAGAVRIAAAAEGRRLCGRRAPRQGRALLRENGRDRADAPSTNRSGARRSRGFVTQCPSLRSSLCVERRERLE